MAKKLFFKILFFGSAIITGALIYIIFIKKPMLGMCFIQWMFVEGFFASSIAWFLSSKKYSRN